MKNYKLLEIEEKMFGERLNLFIGEYSELQKHIKENYGVDMESEGNDAENILLKSYDGKEDNYIWIPKYKNTIEFQRSLIHELLHYTFDVMNRKGIKYSEDSEETFTYFQDYMYGECMKELKIIFKNK